MCVRVCGLDEKKYLLMFELTTNELGEIDFCLWYVSYHFNLLFFQFRRIISKEFLVWLQISFPIIIWLGPMFKGKKKMQ